MKTERHAQIIRLISQYDIETQEELAEKLNQAGFRVTQATISRDIRELKLTKIAMDNGRQKYSVLVEVDAGMAEKYVRVLKEGFVSVDMAQNSVEYINYITYLLYIHLQNIKALRRVVFHIS